MYFGSVKFYKHLICFFIIIIILFIGAALYRLYSIYSLSCSDSIQTNLSLSEVPNKSNLHVSESDCQKSLIGYQSLYPDLYNDMPDIVQHKDKIAYLTFDDGPSSRTLEILDILKENNIKAAFFVVTTNTDLDILKRIKDEGHTIGIHSNSHKYKDIYRSVDAFLDDFNTCYKKIQNETSVNTQIFRFPGGSINAYNSGIYQEIISEMLRRGFLFYDWNISTQDTVLNISASTIYENVKNTVKNQNRLIILCHDSHNNTEIVKALPDIIQFLEKENYTFEKLDNSVEPITFTYK